MRQENSDPLNTHYSIKSATLFLRDELRKNADILNTNCRIQRSRRFREKKITVRDRTPRYV